MLLWTAFRSTYVPVRSSPSAQKLNTRVRSPQDPSSFGFTREPTATFDLYQDAGDSYDYEKGAHAVIPMRWSESTKTLTIGDRKGEYPEMPASIQIRIVWVSAGHGASAAPVASPDKTVEYTGKAISVEAP